MSKQKNKEKKKFSFKNIPLIVKEISAFIAAVTVISSALISFSSYIISKINEETNKKLDSISGQLDNLELDSTRTQLLLLVNHYPENDDEILKVASYYFQDLKGDWYISELFIEWANNRDIDVSNIMSLTK